MRILAVDDDEIQCYTLEKTLKQMGYDVVCAHDGLSAVEQASSGKFDAILLDINLPDMNGFEVCRRIRNLEGVPQPAIISYSGSSGTQPSHREGADAYLTYPVEPGHLSSVIEGAMKKRQSPKTA